MLWIWASLGTAHRVIRWTGAIGGTIAFAGLASWAYHDLDEMRAIALGFFGITAVALELTLGRMKVELVDPRTAAVDSAAVEPIQFSLRDLLAVTTASAVLVFLTKQFLLPIRINYDVAAEILQEAPLAILFSTLAMSSILVVFGWRLRLIACFLFVFCVWLSGFWSEHIPCAGFANAQSTGCYFDDGDHCWLSRILSVVRNASLAPPPSSPAIRRLTDRGLNLS